MAKNKSTVAGALTIAGVEYVVIPKAEYLRLQDLHPEGAEDAHAFLRASVASDLRVARETAGLTQAELAERMGKSQTMISQAESGNARVSERYVLAVLKACGLPEDWKPGKARKGKRGRKVAHFP